MWFALALVALGDAADAAARRAAAHELRQRLRLDAPPPETGVVARLRMEMLRHRENPRVAASATFLLSNLIGPVFATSTPAEALSQGQRTGNPLVEVLPLGVTPDGLAILVGMDDLDERAGPLIPWVFACVAAILREDVRLTGDPLAPSSLTMRLKNTWKEELPNVLDWFYAIHPDLTRLSIPAAIDAATAWHAALPEATLASGLEPGIVVARWTDGATLQRLVTRRAVEDEGKAMRHCVGSHWAEVARGIAVFSYRDATGVPQATFEVEGGRLNDLEGVRNQALTDATVAGRIRVWLTDRETSMGTWSRKLPEAVQQDRPPGVAAPLRFCMEAEEPEGALPVERRLRRFTKKEIEEDWTKFSFEAQQEWAAIVREDRNVAALRQDEESWASSRGNFPTYPPFARLVRLLASRIRGSVWDAYRPDEGRLGTLSCMEKGQPVNTNTHWFSAPRTVPYQSENGWVLKVGAGYQMVVHDLMEGLIQSKLVTPGFEAAVALETAYGQRQAALRPEVSTEGMGRDQGNLPVSMCPRLDLVVAAADAAGLSVPPRARARAKTARW